MLQNKSILIVEDENIIALDIKNRVKLMGYNIAGVLPSGEEAVAKIKDLRPDLILMDIFLKGKITGIEAAVKIHASYNIPIIYITSYNDEYTLKQVSRSSHSGYLVKPFNENELKIKISDALVAAHS